MTTEETVNRGLELVRLSKIIAVSSLSPIIDSSNALKKLDFSIDDWEFFTTVAAVRLGLFCLPASEIDEENFNFLYRQVMVELEGIDQQMMLALEDLTQYLGGVDSDNYILGIGMWVVMNLKHSNDLSHSESVLSQQLSSVLLGNLAEWW